MKIKGHCLITDGTNIILDQHNDIHPGNMSQIISRALANDSNYWINSIAFGNGGCDYYQNEYVPRPPRDGLQYNTWDDSLYDENYRIYLDTIDLELDGGYYNVGQTELLEDFNTKSHPTYSRFNRNKQGVVSYIENDTVYVEILVELINTPTNHMVEGKCFTFSEIGLYSGYTLPEYTTTATFTYKNDYLGAASLTLNFDKLTKTFEYDIVNLVSQLNDSLLTYKTTVTQECTLYFNKLIDTKLLNINKYLHLYDFEPIKNAITYEITIRTKTDNLQQLILTLSKFVSVTVDPYKKLIFNSNTKFKYSSQPNDLFDKLFVQDTTYDYNEITSNYELEKTRTDKNNPLNPEKEAGRLLTHLTFEPIDKPAMSHYYLTYTLSINVAPTPKHTIDFTIPNEYRYDYTYEYATEYKLKEWVIYHQLGYIPKHIQVFIDNKLYTDYTVSYGNESLSANSADNQLTIVFKEPVKGIARLD